MDVVRDYAALFKPALLATAEGGSLLATNHASEVARDSFLRVLERTARKCGRAIRGIEWLPPEEDFPSFDAAPPLKVAWIAQTARSDVDPAECERLRVSTHRGRMRLYAGALV